MFDSNQPFAVEIQSGGLRKARLKFPSDQQIKERTRKQCMIRKEVRRGQTETKFTDILEDDYKLFLKLLIEKPETDFDDADAQLVIERLIRAVVDDSEGSAAEVRVVLEVFGGAKVTAVLQQPRRRQMLDYSEVAVKTLATPKGSETRFNLEPAAKLFDELLISTEGYAEGSAVPITHKDAVIGALVDLQNPD